MNQPFGLAQLVAEVLNLIRANYPDKDTADTAQELARNRYGMEFKNLSGEDLREMRTALEELRNPVAPIPISKAARDRQDRERAARTFIKNEVRRMYGAPEHKPSCGCDLCGGTAS